MPASQPKTRLNNGIEMPMLGLGVYNMYGKEAERAVNEALQIGYRLIDTAAMYQNEQEVGNAIRDCGLSREHIFITTKVSNLDQGYDSTLRAIDVSLKKLQTDYVDLYLVHWPIRDKRKDTWKALEKIYQDGRTRAIGVANYLIPFLKELENYSPLVPALNQVEFSPFLFLRDLLEFCRGKKIQLQAYSPLVRGKKLNDPRLQQLAKKYKKSTAQIILRWDIQSGVSIIPKSSNLQRLKENFDIFDFALSAQDMDIMNSLHDGYRVVEDPMDYW
ncbi:MAG: aldo/keto reductase [Chitinophagales bacterium]